MSTEDLPRFCRFNPDCRLHAWRDASNLLVVDRFGKARHRLLYCRACKDRFSEFKGTPLFNSRLPHDKVLAILEHLREEEGSGTNGTSRSGKPNGDEGLRRSIVRLERRAFLE